MENVKTSTNQLLGNNFFEIVNITFFKTIDTAKIEKNMMNKRVHFVSLYFCLISGCGSFKMSGGKQLENTITNVETSENIIFEIANINVFQNQKYCQNQKSMLNKGIFFVHFIFQLGKRM